MEKMDENIRNEETSILLNGIIDSEHTDSSLSDEESDYFTEDESILSTDSIEERTLNTSIPEEQLNLLNIMLYYNQFITEGELPVISDIDIMYINLYNKMLNTLSKIDDFLVFIFELIIFDIENFDEVEKNFKNCEKFLKMINNLKPEFIENNWDNLTIRLKKKYADFLSINVLTKKIKNKEIHKFIAKDLDDITRFVYANEFFINQNEEIGKIYLPVNEPKGYPNCNINVKLVITLYKKKIISISYFIKLLHKINEEDIYKCIESEKHLFLDLITNICYNDNPNILEEHKKIKIIEIICPLITEDDIKYFESHNLWKLLQLFPDKVDWTFIDRKQDESNSDYILRIKNKTDLINMYPHDSSIQSDTVCYITHDLFTIGEYYRSCTNNHPVKLIPSLSLKICGKCRQPINTFYKIVNFSLPQ